MIEIRHIALENAPERLSGAPTEALLVFWAEERPVGQVYTTLPTDGVATDSLIERAVDPAARREPLPVSRHPLRASVVICTRDRPEELARCLASLSRQTRRADEIVVVDNGSKTNETRRVADAAGADYVREERRGLDIARNTGARSASGEVVAYADDDVSLHPRWLERMLASFDAHIDAVTGLVLPQELATPAQVAFEKHWAFGRGFRQVDFGPEFLTVRGAQACPVWRIGAGASMAFRREVFTKIGYFDERLDAGAAGCSGDSEFWHRMLSAGMTIRYAPAAVAFHRHRREWAGLRRQIFAYARGHVVALLVQHERTRRRGDFWRAWVGLPLYYAKRAMRRLRGRAREEDRLLGEEIRGWASGVAYYYRTPRRLAGVACAIRAVSGAATREGGRTGEADLSA